MNLQFTIRNLAKPKTRRFPFVKSVPDGDINESSSFEPGFIKMASPDTGASPYYILDTFSFSLHSALLVDNSDILFSSWDICIYEQVVLRLF